MTRWRVVAIAGVVCLADVEAAMARQTMSFVPGDKTRLIVPAVLPDRATRADRVRQPARSHGSRVAKGRGAADPAAATPGPGFTMMDGVLTYPAPARFQPKNLKRD